MANRSFIKTIQLFSLAVFFALTGIICLILAVNSYQQYRLKTQDIHDSYLSIYKSRLQSNINNIKALAESQIRNIDNEMKEEVFYRVQEAIDIAYEIYISNNANQGPEIIQGLIEDTLRAIRYNQGTGYYFIIDFDQEKMVMYPPDSRIEGQKLKDLSKNWQSVTDKFSELIAVYGDGFLQYRWPKPNEANDIGNESEKISFVKFFAPYKWSIGSGLYYDDYSKVIQDKILKDIKTLNTSDNNYVLFNTNKELLTGKLSNAGTNYQLLEPGQFHIIGNSLYYAAVIGKLGWVIGSTTDLSSLQQRITEEQQQILNGTLSQLALILLTSLMLIFMFFWLMKNLSTRISDNFAVFTQTFKQAATTNQTISVDEITYQELTKLCETANEMIDENREIKNGLESSREFLELVLNAVPSIIFTMKPNGVMTNLNSSARKFLEESRSLHKSPLRLLLEKLQLTNIEIFTPLETRKPAVFPTKNIEWNQHEMFIVARITPLLALNEVVIQLENVTERIKMENMMVQTEKMMSVGGMAAGIAHEINNPLSIIGQATQNLIRRISPNFPTNQQVAEQLNIDLHQLNLYLDERQIPRFLRDIQSAVERSAEIIRNMLSFSATTISHQESCHIGRVVHETLALTQNDYDLQKKYNFSKTKIDLDIAENLPVISIKKVEVEQVLYNLIKNAAQAMTGMTKDNFIPTISIAVASEDDWIKISVNDNGPGIDTKNIERIFEPFFTTKEPGVGTGLGLSVSYFIITKRHNGQFWVKSVVDQGTTFTILLPTGEQSEDLE